jgi:hypothetical protein
MTVLPVVEASIKSKPGAMSCGTRQAAPPRVNPDCRQNLNGIAGTAEITLVRESFDLTGFQG